jgi:general secretion pathway protein K
MTRAPRGFALLAVLWVVSGLSVLSLSIALIGRDALAASRNRNDLVRARWRAEECAAQAQAVIGQALVAGNWAGLDRVVSAARARRTDCDVSLRSDGARLDINAADAETIGALLAALGVTQPRRDSMVDALLDWRDADTIPRPLGAERTWYARRGRTVPRNGPLADPRELHLVRGFEHLTALDTLCTVEATRVDLNHASPILLAALPGFGNEALSRAEDLRDLGAPIGEITAFAGQLTNDGRSKLLSRYADLVARSTTEPDAWILTARATTGSPAVTAALELKLARAGDRAAIVRRRTWTE